MISSVFVGAAVGIIGAKYKWPLLNTAGIAALAGLFLGLAGLP
jgi:hypothetical protein